MPSNWALMGCYVVRLCIEKYASYQTDVEKFLQPDTRKNQLVPNLCGFCCPTLFLDPDSFKGSQ